ncbi:binding-protein-dependent transport systems inner membrane component [Ketogulonicigenium robustum]|uniref:Binding-protein-dependent transport systems inner membrane component n=1 Tax=Ketogulonicigenium robustum TaxID=92947 RepID=A0A1W6P0V4_9RHOB|nr:methionine ABC transporter permease [Ketogulonicigenium robustum]ARO15142.1 binding-protein-dependent transport systems inner membrane component [Ketogulonicigenium robustum]
MSPQMIDRLWKAFFDTLLMVGVSAVVTVLFAVPLALFLIVTAPGGIHPLPRLNRAVGMVVNCFRAVPFIVLLVALIPFTRLIVGTTIGVWAAIVPLSVASIPFFARIAEVALREVDRGLVEAAQSFGCTTGQIIRHVLLPEALPAMVGGMTVTLITIIGASAMAGAVGAGGLGDLAIRYGYQRFDTTVMVVVIVILVVLVSAVQFAGDRLARYLSRR